MVDYKENVDYVCLQGADAIDSAWLTETFSQFIDEIYETGRRPYQWQLRLLKSVAETGKWPEVLNAPTGAGKTTVIEIHVFLNGLAGWGIVENRIPRRLILTVNRRALVDDQYEHALLLAKRMKLIAQGNREGVVATIWHGLLLRSDMDVTLGDVNSRLGVLSLRGGDQDEVARNDWRLYPTTTMIVCATPDMFGSRLLLRGYGVSRNARAPEAGLFAYDSIAVIDEAHMNRQLEVTARQIARLEALSQKALGVLPLQVMAATATPATNILAPIEGAEVVSVLNQDLKVDDTLHQRLCRPKPLQMLALEDDFRHESIRQIVDCCAKIYEQVGGPVGCIVNMVSKSVQIADALKKEFGQDSVVCVIGRMRSLDRLYAIDKLKSSETHFIVGTQALEVGLDIDLSGLVTQLASGTSLAQRAGRVNRFGKRAIGPITVLVPPDLAKNCAPYQGVELEEALVWLEGVSQDSDRGLTPWYVSSKEGCPPQSMLKRELLERLEWSDADYLSNTSEDLAPETTNLSGYAANLDLWLRDEFSDDTEVCFVVRSMCDRFPSDSSIEIPYSDNDIIRLLSLVPPLSAELFPTSLHDATHVLKGYLSKEKGAGLACRVFLIRRDEPIQVIHSDIPVIEPSDIFVVDETAAIFLGEVVREKGSDTKNDIYADLLEESDSCPTGMPVVVNVSRHSSDEVLLSPALSQIDAIAESFLSVDDEDAGLSPDQLFSEWLDGIDVSTQPIWENGLSVARFKEIVEEDELHGALDCISRGKSSYDGYWLVYTPATNRQMGWWQETAAVSSEPVRLESHLNDVADRAHSLGETLNLPMEITEALEEAGRFHDEGKRDVRFQGLLRLGDRRAQRIEDDLAKGRFASRAKALEYRASCGLRGWRHEQRSAAVVWNALDGSDIRELATCLVGTSHGRGRALFADGAKRLLPDDEEEMALRDAATFLFDRGDWEWIVNRTNRIYGIWGMAYLEALLRAADMQVSSEGR